MRQFRAVLWTVLVAQVLMPAALRAQVPDHLKCYKVKESAKNDMSDRHAGPSHREMCAGRKAHLSRPAALARKGGEPRSNQKERKAIRMSQR
jgi:hypothetical protein